MSIDLDDDEEEPDDKFFCPECGSDDLENLGEDDAGNVWYECTECGEKFSEGEEEE
jgi:DNA-directed RNA polymerase subunit RPC12/RpoP